MKAEMVPPGAVVYTAALAECRWAGEQKHVDYLLQEMEAEGLTIVPGSSIVAKTVPVVAGDDHHRQLVRRPTFAARCVLRQLHTRV